MYKLRRLADAHFPAAIERACHYRTLNRPDEAESICRDVLAVAPDHVEARRTLGLALTDRFPGRWEDLFDETLTVFAALPSEYERLYYTGVAWERLAKAHIDANQFRRAAHAFEHAFGYFDKAGRLAAGAPDPVLRWNGCVRTIAKHPEVSRALEDASPESATFLYD
jgi:hypothetical protein